MKRVLSVAVLALGAVLVSPILPASAASYVPVSGSGSTWSANAMDQWRRNVNQYGMRIDYQASGSSDGRNQFRNGTVDFAVSEIPYGLKDGNVVDPPPTRPFAYMPIVAGGTAFMYNLKIGPNRVTQLRLSGDTIAKIFTGVITKWDDAAIKADNPGLTLPPIKVVPVVRSDGSGTTAQFTAWLAAMYPDIWNAYCQKVGRGTPCGFTSNFPSGPGFVAQSGSLGVSGYVKQDQSVGAITYVEYSYAKAAGFPAAKVLNKAGYYVLPTAEAVAVGLLGARINSDLTSNLSGVYASSDKRAYPLSSYSYMVIPTSLDNGFSNEKGNTLADFANYFLCQGQQQADALGYSPLPINLVEAGFDQIKRIPGAVIENINIANCKNPTFSADGTNTLAKTAPQPPACDAKGPTQCGTAAEGGAAGGGAGGGSGGGSSGGSGGGGSGGGTGGGTTSGGTTSGGGTTGGGTTGGAVTDVPVDAGGAAVVVDPETGQVIAAEPVVDPTTGEVIVDPAAAAATGGAVTGGAYVAGIPVSTEASSGWGPYTGLLVATFAVVLALLFAPPLVARYMAARRTGGDA
jgi:phosphate ABC transporter phosphate-binding protein